MGWVIVAIFVLPVLLCFAVIAAIVATGLKTGRTGKRAYRELKPYLADLKEKGTRAQQKGLEFNERANGLTATFEEITGRWAFITDSFKETTKSPMVKIAGMAGKYAGGKGRD